MQHHSKRGHFETLAHVRISMTCSLEYFDSLKTLDYFKEENAMFVSRRIMSPSVGKAALAHEHVKWAASIIG